MRIRHGASGWRGAALVAVVYVYFLIFAQFGFLTRLAESGIAADALKFVMAAMAAGAILFSLMTPRLRMVSDPAGRLRAGLATAAVAAVLSLMPMRMPIAVVVAFLIGTALGITTVTLVTHLRLWTGNGRGILYVGLGTGVAYFICNVPAVFTAAPRTQAILAAALCAIACALPLARRLEGTGEAARPRSHMPFLVALASFAALIWLDSAAFYIIQHTAALKAGTWLGSAHLWANGGLHLAAAIVAAALLERGRAAATLALAFGALGFACVLLLHPALVLSASLFYPIGVSLYSVALVAYPSFLSPAHSVPDRAKQAGSIYAIAGWIGSGLGIGLGQNLGRVPLAFVAVAGVVVLAPAFFALVRSRFREVAVLACAAIAAWVVYGFFGSPSGVTAATAAQRGRQVYISEGCISCHSQYVRPDTPDVLIWGPIESLASVHEQKPPLIGNRRQGPDLSEVGLRRSPLWLKAHLVSPAEVSYRSPMPSFAFLFRDERGDDLVAYLASLRAPGEQEEVRLQAAWEPSTRGWAAASAMEGKRVYRQYCATCHDPQGATRLHWMGAWSKSPPDPAALDALAQNEPQAKLARVAKFGIRATDMPGHEYLSDAQIASVTLWLKDPGNNVPHSLTH